MPRPGAPVAADLLERVTVIHADAADANTALTTAVAQADLIIDAIYGIGGRDELPDDLTADPKDIADVIVHMCDLPDHLNFYEGMVVQNKIPFLGRG